MTIPSKLRQVKRQHTWLPKERYGGLSFLPVNLNLNIISESTESHEISALITKSNHVYTNT